MKRKLGVILLVAAIALSMGLVPSASVEASPGVIWSIGSFDNSRLEFRHSSFTGINEATYNVGVDTASDFPAFLYITGYTGSWEGAGVHKVTINFFLTKAYRDVTLTYRKAGAETDEVTLDGGTPQTVTGPGENIYQTYKMSLGTLSAGSHSIVVECVERGGADGAHTYDALELSGLAVTSIPLCAGQHTDVGTVSVWNDGTNLCVKYETRGDWMMTETHLAVVDDDGDFPTTKTGNPMVGHFPDGDDYDPPVSKDTFTFNLDDEGWASCTDLYVAAHAVVVRPIDDCWESVWQVGDVEMIDPMTGKPTNYYDEFNHQGPVGHFYPQYTDPFVVGTTPDSEFPWISNYANGYATDFKVRWYGELRFGGELTISWSPGKSALETKIITSIDGGETGTFVASGSTDPNGWQGYPLVVSNLALDSLEEGWHEFRFQHTSGDGTLWDWVRLDKPCEETAWGDGCDGERFVERGNWATYFMYHVEE